MLSKTIVHHNTIKRGELFSKTKTNEALFLKHTTPITVIRIIAAKNENEPAERGFISGCLV
jgi:hypothetical protein